MVEVPKAPPIPLPSRPPLLLSLPPPLPSLPHPPCCPRTPCVPQVYLIKCYTMVWTLFALLAFFVAMSLFTFIVPLVFRIHLIDEAEWGYRFRVITVCPPSVRAPFPDRWTRLSRLALAANHGPSRDILAVLPYTQGPARHFLSLLCSFLWTWVHTLMEVVDGAGGCRRSSWLSR